MRTEHITQFKALGTEINVKIVVSNEEEKKRADSDLFAVKRLYEEKQKIFDRFNSESELNDFNLNLGIRRPASPDFLYLAGRILEYNKLSGGIFDPRVIDALEAIGYSADFGKIDRKRIKIDNKRIGKIEGPLAADLLIDREHICFRRRMDFSGIAKGYITDCAEKLLKNKGWKNFLVDSGGDMFAAGENKDGRKWRIEIEGIPEEKLILEMSGKGIATSGISRKKWEVGGKRFHHLVNPKNPEKFSFELRTVSVVEKSTEEADGRAKVLVLLGKNEGMDFANEKNIAAIFLDYKGNIFISREAKKHISGKE